MVFQTLNRLKWASGLADARIVILHRGTPENRKVIEGKDVTEVKRSYFVFSKAGRETVIPNHRVLEVALEKKVIWKRTARF